MGKERDENLSHKPRETEWGGEFLCRGFWEEPSCGGRFAAAS